MFKQYFLNKIAGLMGISNSTMAYLHSFNKLGRNLTTGLPSVLMALGARNFLRGLLNRFVIPINLDWVWPYWINRQYDPLSPSFVARGFQIASLNMTQRNWTAIGARHSTKEAIVDQRGLIVPLIHGWSLDAWIYYDGKLYAPSQMPEVSQYLCQNLPIVMTEFQVGELKVTLESFVEKIEKEDIIFQKAKVVNLSNKPVEFSFIFSIRPYNTEGLSLINNLKYSNQEFHVNERVGLYLPQVPDRVLCHNYDQGDVSIVLGKDWIPIYKTACPLGFCTGMAVYDFTITEHEQKDISAFMPIERKLSFQGLEKLDSEQILTECIASWRDRIDNKSMRIHVPDQKMQAAFRANLANLLIFHDGDSITPGPFSYHFFWYRDAAYMINALDKVGFFNEAQEILNSYPKRQRKIGHFSSQQGEWDSNGQAIWTMVQHYRLNNDKEFLKHVYPSIKGAINWISKHMLKHKDPALDGLHPPGLSAEHFGSNDYYYWDDFWSLAGLREGIFAAEVLGYEADKKKFERAFTKLSSCLDRSLKIIEERFGLPIIPISPAISRRYDSAMIGSIACVYPLHIFAKDDPRFLNTLNYLWENHVIDNGFFHHVMHSGYGTYLTAHIAECFVTLRDKRAIDMLNWLLEKATDTFTWPEAINPQNFGGNMGDGHHGWAAADFLILVRNMLILEEDNTLVLLPCVPDDWFKVDEVISINNAPTYFGTVGFKFVSNTDKSVDLSLYSNFHNIPESIEINLASYIKVLRFRDKDYKVIDGKVVLSREEIVE